MKHLILSCALLLLTACSTTIPEAAPNRLRVAISKDAAPILFEEKGEYKGLEPDLIQMMAAEMGREVIFIPTEFKDLLSRLEQGEADVALGSMTITEARAARANFSLPYLGIGQVALMRREDQRKYFNPILLVKTKDRVGAVEGTTGDFFVQSGMTLAERFTFSSPEAGMKALEAGKIDLFIHDAPSIWWLASRNEGGLIALNLLLTREQLGIPVDPRQPELLKEMNDLLQTWQENGKLDALLSQWIP